MPTANLNQFTSRRAITKPLSKNFNKNAPTHAPKTVPIPPKRDAPPITAAAIACNSYPIPVEGKAAFVLKTIKIPERPARKEQRIKLRILTLFVFTPIAAAAARLAPVE